MQFTYDPRYNVAYIRFQEASGQVETLRISDDLNVDIAPNGKVYGIELLNANAQFKKKNNGKLLFVNKATGHKSTIVLTR